MATLSPEELQWLQAQLAAQNYGGILAEADKRGITIGELSGLTGYSPEQINAYSDSQRAQQPQQMAGPVAVDYPQPTSPAQPAYNPPSLEAWLSSAQGNNMITEQGYLGAEQYYKDNIASGRWGTSGPTDPYKGESFAPVTINGGQWARTGMGFDDMMADPLRAGFMQQAGITANDFYKDPQYGWVTPFDKFHSQVELPIGNAKKSSLGSMMEGFGPMLMAMGGVNLLGALAPGMFEGGFQSLLSSLGQNAASQGGSFTDILKQFGLDFDPAYGVNPRSFGSEFEPNLFEGNRGDFDPTFFNQIDPSYFGNGMSGAVGHAGSMTPEQLAASSNLGSTMSGAVGTAGAGAGLVGAGAALNAIGSGLNSNGNGLTSNPTSGGNATPNLLQTLFPNTGISDLLKGLIPAGLGAFGAKEQMDAFGKMQDKYLSLGQPYRDRLNASYQPGFSMNNEPGYADALKLSSDSVLRGLSAKTGNPFDQPNSMTSALDYVTKSTALPALQNYRGQLGNFGGLGVSQAAPFGQGQAQASGGIYDALGFGLNQAMNPGTDFEKLLKGFGGMKLNFGGSMF